MRIFIANLYGVFGCNKKIIAFGIYPKATIEKLSMIILVLGNQHPERRFFFAKTTYKDVIF
jgi:hypothetical protein